MNFAELTRLASSSLPWAEKAGKMVKLARHLLVADLCVVQTLEEDYLSVFASDSTPTDQRSNIVQQQRVIGRETLDRLRRAGSLRAPAIVSPVQLNAYASQFYAPLLAGIRLLGLFTCHYRLLHQQTSHERDLLYAIANLIAVGMQAEQLGKRITHAPPLDAQVFMEHLRTASSTSPDTLRSFAARLDFHLTQPHAVALFEVIPQAEEPEGSEQALFFVQRHIQEAFHHSLLSEQGRMLTGLLHLGRISPQNLRERLVALANAVADANLHCRLLIGFSNPVSAARAYHAAFAEAEEALSVGRYLPGQPDVIYFGDLGIYRPLVFLARTDTLTDQFQDLVQKLATYDRQRGTHLLDTLEVWLSGGSHLERTARQMTINRNTVIQRLDRMEALLQIDVRQQDALWFPLQIAIKLFRIRQSAVVCPLAHGPAHKAAEDTPAGSRSSRVLGSWQRSGRNGAANAQPAVEESDTGRYEDEGQRLCGSPSARLDTAEEERHHHQGRR